MHHMLGAQNLLCIALWVLTFSVVCSLSQETKLQVAFCPPNNTFSTIQYACIPCPSGATTTVAEPNVCRCLPGHRENSPGQHPISCEACPPGLFPSRDGLRCLPCGRGPFNSTSILNHVRRFSSKKCRNETTVVAVAYLDGIYSQQLKLKPSITGSKECLCPTGFALTEQVGPDVLDEKFCVPCDNGELSETDPYECTICRAPFIPIGGKCSCPPNTELDFSKQTCLSLTSIDSVSKQTRLTAVVPYRFVDGGATVMHSSSLFASMLKKAAARCWERHDKDCQALANLCVLQGYADEASACSTYLTIQNREQCRGVSCERSQHLPWLFYLRNVVQVVQSREVTSTFVLHPKKNKINRLRFVVSIFTVDGTWLGNRTVTDQVFLCDASGDELSQFFNVGGNHRMRCNLNIGFFYASDATVFYDLFLVDGSVLRPVPVMVDYSIGGLSVQQLVDFTTRLDALSSFTTRDPPRLVRRFLVYDNIGTRESNKESLMYITLAKRIDIVVAVQPNQRIQIPLVYIHYQSYSMRRVEPSFLPANNTLGSTIRMIESCIWWTKDFSAQKYGIEAALIAVCVVAFFTSGVRSYGWLRRRQTAEWDLSFMIRHLSYLCCHISFFFAVVIILTCWWWYLVYKHQSELEMVLMLDIFYLFPMLWAAASAAIFHVAYLIYTQVNADVVLIDWERSRGELVRERHEAPVGMWRSVCIANEFNEIQIVRGWNVELVMAIVLLLLEGVGYISLSAAWPDSTRQTLQGTYSDPSLRIAISSFCWLMTALVMYLLERVILYRFVTVHPIQQFVDLVGLSNISVLIMYERQWGWYLHGRILHPYADVSMMEFQDNLRREEEGILPMRGVLVGNLLPCTAFEVFASADVRLNLDAAYQRLSIENMRSLRENPNRSQRKLFEMLSGQAARTRILTPESTKILGELNTFLKSVLERACEEALPKDMSHAAMDFPPNVLFSTTRLYADNEYGWAASTLLGIDHFLFLAMLLFYLAVDYHMQHSFGAMAITYLLNFLLVTYRAGQGQSNLAHKLTFDDRIFI